MLFWTVKWKQKFLVHTDLWNHLEEVLVQERTLHLSACSSQCITHRIPFRATHPTLPIMSLILLIPALHSCLVLFLGVRFSSFTFKLSWRTLSARILRRNWCHEAYVSHSCHTCMQLYCKILLGDGNWRWLRSLRVAFLPCFRSRSLDTHVASILFLWRTQFSENLFDERVWKYSRKLKGM